MNKVIDNNDVQSWQVKVFPCPACRNIIPMPDFEYIEKRVLLPERKELKCPHCGFVGTCWINRETRNKKGPSRLCHYFKFPLLAEQQEAWIHAGDEGKQ